MQIREATQNDIPQILKVLKASLGETSSKKTELVWRYKHIDNPFGKSLVLVATEEGEVIGVRAFMRWQWQIREKVFSTFRAVDTATHPAHQGKGIFKKLTLKALQIAKERGDHFVFNTPNSQSKPGYLKMGWEEVDQIKVQLRPVKFIRFKQEKFTNGILGRLEECKVLLKDRKLQAIQKNKLFTPKDIDFLRWRYYENPIQKYKIISNDKMIIVGYPKIRKKIIEFRISEAIIAAGQMRSSKAAILQLAEESGAQFLSLAPTSGIKFKCSLTRKFGPTLLFRDIDCNEDFSNLNIWNYSLGDLELF